MAINLSEIPAAVKLYLNVGVKTKIEGITPALGTSINPNESFSFTVKVTNADSTNGGIAMTNFKIRVLVETPSAAKLVVPSGGSAVDGSGAPLSAGALVSQFTFSPLDQKLPIGLERTFVLSGKAGTSVSGGFTKLRAKAFADVDLDQLFPKGEDTIESTVSINVVG